MTELPARRLLLVHAHPDDESITTGATMAKYAAEGAHVTLVTCTLGEEGEVIPDGLAHLAADRDDSLGAHRVGELAAAMKEVGVTDHRFLGGPGRYRDSGMMGVEQNDRPGAFWSADLDEAAAHLVAVIREVRPQVLVTYDPDGGYGHPDHIQAHRVAMRAADLAADPAFHADLGAPHTIDKIYWNRAPRSVVEERFRWMSGALRHSPFGTPAAVADVPGVTDDERITAEIDGRPYKAAKAAAMAAHVTQITVSGPLFILSNELAQPIFDVEYYELVRGEASAEGTARETDLFAGVERVTDMAEVTAQ
ncbi:MULTISPECIES: N-acetyl-1-D-myo-inositol-2-amino-2-deoxy-alpha-D-glucopyranoside deacetylase [Streptomyces]|uniref:1D-myo-inositol 2-acetamido-2-deoxy-alpha-D-glucopyranoside deacetylase n=1 Tax=Streptomyces venezuelae TaxID=54571 RepID=A0A5P2BFY3_STRVZ|nr:MULTISPECIES: N-acetyl-1-D-myo-inositol-2-amino-2-deoxy-alpha-D-glucopyranoside deacetylase [Streptomyces]NEA00800.1 N-acetyl-1-D-myo-inositol-2-amino-2-deoxy-alpha-D-glucopyranoside deacetylase [Streptomyces sp. SID10116]MYY82959.1 N-acetyl-1-D-myo-inositol-2-amino-2-deoxy-alpha-D-glucopyranoside deacetylase [Streptomyces sp. SID335]MYZ14860.1 N-acetyl-1-D-myo-inositol-2-amino-2-deoxy-alpha-D-glucopyranoside deacetylase [Streptomyces sp. SID337]NDZ89648.1 N-acetyl-1-D-myo-inositol-2-amino-2